MCFFFQDFFLNGSSETVEGVKSISSQFISKGTIGIFYQDAYEVVWKCGVTQALISCFSSLPYHSCAQLRLFEKQQTGKKTMPFSLYSL